MLLRLLLTLLISVNSEPVFSYWQRFVQAILMAGRRHKKLNLLNFQTQSIKFYSKTCYKDRLTSNLHLHSKYISLLGFFFKLSICPPNVKRSTFFSGFTIWPPPPPHHHQGSAMNQHIMTIPAFYKNLVIVLQETEHSKTQSLFKNKH